MDPGSTAVNDVRGVDGRAYDLREIIDVHAATVLIWWATECSCAARYQERMHALRQRYRSEQVAIYAVSSNAGENRHDLEHARDNHDLQLPLLVDPAGHLAQQLAVTRTPTAVVLDADYTVRFRGWIDNEREPGDPKRIAYLERAVDSVLGGSSAPVTTPVFGCPITRG